MNNNPQTTRTAGGDETNEPHPALRFKQWRGWDDAKEMQALELWNNTKVAWDVPESLVARYVQLWKICIHEGGCTPFDIVGVIHRIETEREIRRSRDKRYLGGSVWSKSFSLALSRLVTHYIWPRNYTAALSVSLAATIQYVVILRTNDRRVWDPSRDSGNVFLEAMRDMSAANRGTAMPEVHARVRSLFAERQIDIATISLSNLFLELETSVKVPIPVFDASQDAPYKVRTRDLQMIEDAIDRLVEARIGTSDSTETCFQRFTNLHERKEPSVNNLSGFHDRAILEECRRMMVMESEVALPAAATEARLTSPATTVPGNDIGSGFHAPSRSPATPTTPVPIAETMEAGVIFNSPPTIGLFEHSPDPVAPTTPVNRGVLAESLPHRPMVVKSSAARKDVFATDPSDMASMSSPVVAVVARRNLVAARQPFATRLRRASSRPSQPIAARRSLEESLSIRPVVPQPFIEVPCTIESPLADYSWSRQPQVTSPTYGLFVADSGANQSTIADSHVASSVAGSVTGTVAGAVARSVARSVAGSSSLFGLESSLASRLVNVTNSLPGASFESQADILPDLGELLREPLVPPDEPCISAFRGVTRAPTLSKTPLVCGDDDNLYKSLR